MVYWCCACSVGCCLHFCFALGVGVWTVLGVACRCFEFRLSYYALWWVFILVCWLLLVSLRNFVVELTGVHGWFASFSVCFMLDLRVWG